MIIRGKKLKKLEKNIPDLGGSLDSVVKLASDLNELKEAVESTVENKLSEVDTTISEMRDEIERIRQIKKGEDGNDADEEAIAQYILSNIPIPKDGESVDEEKVINTILKKIKLPDEKAIAKKVLTLLPDRKADLKIIQENIEIDPMSVIDKIMALPEEKRKKLRFSQDNVDGLSQTIRAFQSQLGRGYLHGGGLSTVSHDETLTGDGTPSSPLSVVGGGSGGGSYFFDQTPNTDSTFGLLGGTIDGVNTLFTVSQTDYLTGRLVVFLNGQEIAQGTGGNEFQEGTPSSGTFNLNTAPEVGDVVSAMYVTVSSVGGIESIVAGTPNVTIDNTDPLNPIISVAGAGTGTVTSFSSGDLSPLFTTSVATSTTTPSLSFALTNAGANTYFGNATGSTGAPSYTSAAALTRVNDTNVTLTLSGSPTTALLTAASLTLGWTGQLAVTRGGTGLSSVSQGDILYASASNTLTTLAKSTTANQFLSNGGTSNNPAWATVTAAMIGSGAALTKIDDTNVTLTLGGSPATALLAATSLTLGWTGQLSAARGGTGQDSSAWAQGDIPYISATGTWNHLAKNTSATRYLSNTGTTNNPAWAQVDLSNGVTGRLAYSNLTQGSARSVLGVTGNATADVASIQGTADQVLVVNGAGTSLAFGTVATAGITNNAVTYAKMQQAGAYTMPGNNTNASANLAEHTLKYLSIQAITATITWTAGAAPSGSSNLSYNWTQMGNIVWYCFALDYATDGTTITGLNIAFPSDMPSPVEPTGFNAASDQLYKTMWQFASTKTGTNNTGANLGVLRRNSGDTAYEFNTVVASGTYSQAWGFGFYFTS